jgi:hypothetical protein
MADLRKVRLTTRLQRKDPRLPVYVVIPANSVKGWALAGTTVVEGSANGVAFGRRNIKAWGKGSTDWFIEFTAPFCKTAELAVGDEIAVELQLADASTPAELLGLFEGNTRLAAAWAALSDSARRDAGEHIRAAKSPATRERRAAAVIATLIHH